MFCDLDNSRNSVKQWSFENKHNRISGFYNRDNPSLNIVINNDYRFYNK